MTSQRPVVRLQLGSRTIELSELAPSVLIGRDPGTCALATEDLEVSRRHAQVALSGQVPYITDLGSSNGTWVDNRAVGSEPVALRPGQQIYVGYQPLSVEWMDGGQATIVAEMPPELKALVASRKAGFTNQPVAPLAKLDRAAPGTPAELTYRRQGKNSNGVLLIALPSETCTNESVIEGYIEFTALDEETISSIIVELVEHHAKGPKKGHVWDRMIVKQGPWRSRKGDVLPMPFELRVPPGTSVSGDGVRWEIRGLVDIDWAFDVKATSSITMRNLDIERIRAALGALDYRIDTLDAEPLGQTYRGTFEPPAQRQAQLGISKIELDVEYLGTTIRIELKVRKSKLFKLDRKTELTFGLEAFRRSSQQELSRRFYDEIEQLMAR